MPYEITQHNKSDFLELQFFGNEVQNKREKRSCHSPRPDWLVGARESELGEATDARQSVNL